MDQRKTAIGLGVGFVAVLGGVLYYGRAAAPKAAPAAIPSLAVSSTRLAASAEESTSATRPDDAGIAGLLDGRPLPSDAPKSVVFGVILFNYHGAQDAPRDARDKATAFAKAKSALEEAKKDFRDASKHGDAGSTGDAGRIPRGVLEPSIEYALFTLKKGDLLPEPIDTPRGYWVLKRLD